MRTSEVTLFPYANASKWSQDLNRLLAGAFDTLWMPSGVYGYHRARSMTYAAHSHLLAHLNRQRSRAVFYVCLNRDFNPDPIYMTPARGVYGFVHMASSASASAQERRLDSYDRGVYDLADGVFVASELARERTTPKAHVVGLPLFGPPKPPSQQRGGRILFNHRLAPEKRWDKLANLPEELRDRLTISTAQGSASAVEKARPICDKVFVNPPFAEYERILSSHAYALSYAKVEHFGYAVIEAVWNGAFALAPASPDLPYREFLPPAMLYEDEREVPERIARLDEKPLMRANIVRAGQEGLARFRSDRWLSLVLDKMGVG